ncbi:MAG: 2-oxoglutarate dehydrogenase E1 component [Pirellulaceae bacterium]
MSHPAPFDCDAQSVDYVERLLQQSVRDRETVSPAWRSAFQAIADQSGNGAMRRGPSFTPHTVFNPASPSSGREQLLQERVGRLVEAFRREGHRAAEVDPLGLQRPDDGALRLERFGISAADLDRQVSAEGVGHGGRLALRELTDKLRATYCGPIAYQFAHIHEPPVREWLLDRIERQEPLTLTGDQCRQVLKRLTETELFDSYLRKKYPGTKTFSLEGSEALILLLDAAIEQAAASGVNEIVMAMAHRGRLNVLASIIGKPASAIFREFEDVHQEEYLGAGDVKYHLGASGDRQVAGEAAVHLSLCFNPSHLEYVNPIALGRMRAKQDRAGDDQRERGLVLLLHGDAAFAGEGIVQESLNLSQLPDYEVGGALHVIVDNQLGFTTHPRHGRSMAYASEVACMLQSPILRVNSDHVEAVLHAVTLAMDFRRKFRRDVVVELVCYRRWGHNEGDEPSFTQPLMYEAIEHQPPVRETFAQGLVDRGIISSETADEFTDTVKKNLREQHKLASENVTGPADVQQAANVWEDHLGGPEPKDDNPDTGVATDRLRDLLERTTELPSGFHLHKKLRRAFEQRRRMARGEEPLDWSAAEALAFASLAEEGHPVRLAGQDSARGTFSQRHAVLHDVVDGHPRSIFSGNVEIIDSPLSEAAAMAFEYGYSLDHPESLVLWEAQFGDFVNAAQVVVDQFLSSAEDKWNRLSGLVLLLPHGFEGQGPEHSSARLERFLTLAAEDNLQVVQPSTPAQYFHSLRRQVLRQWRKPLIVLTPKSLLRHKAARSPLEELAGGSFRRVIPADTKSPRRLLLCSGKLYYDLEAARQESQRDDVAIARVEQFYPLHDKELERACQQADGDTKVFWVQDEPENMGAWPSWKRRFGDRFLAAFDWQVIARPESASPATGSKASHKIEHDGLIARAFADDADIEPSQKGNEPHDD